MIVLGAFLASFSAALLSHAPGGLGVLELIFVAGVLMIALGLPLGIVSAHFQGRAADQIGLQDAYNIGNGHTLGSFLLRETPRSGSAACCLYYIVLRLQKQAKLRTTGRRT